jgi:cytochrome P450
MIQTVNYNTGQPPLAAGLPFLGNGLEMAGNIQMFFVKYYNQLGPIYRVKALQQRFVIFAGLEANQFLWKSGHDYLSNENTMGSLSDEFGMMVHVLEGEPHSHLRKLLGAALSPEVLTSQWERFIHLTQQHIATWPVGQTLPVVPYFQSLAAEQLAVMLGNQSSVDHFEQLRYVFELALDVRLARKWPMAFLRLPAYQKRKAEIFAFMRDIMAAHRTTTRATPDLVDVALNAVDAHGKPYSEEEQIGMILQGYFGAINTTAYMCSFMLYALFRHPEIMAQVVDEVRQVFSGGMPTPQQLRKLSSLHALAQESLRMYDPAPGSVRTVSKAFDFCGYHIEAGTPAIFAFSVTHYLPEFFPDPYTFSISRDNYLENQRIGAYRPFSLGVHTCLGAGFAEVQAMTIMAVLLQQVGFAEIPPALDKVKIVAAPGLHPNRHLKMKLV